MPSDTRFIDAIESHSVEKTHYSRTTLQTKIVHIGFGAFHRAHQAVYTDLANEADSTPWGIFGINLFRKGKLTEAFAKQDNLATLVEKGTHSTTKRVVRSFTGAMNIADQGVQVALAKMCEPQVAIVSLTITEKGYCLTPEGLLNQEHSLILQDLISPQSPISAIGIITEALRLRRRQKKPPFSVMSCDNIPENGHKTKAAILGYATLVDPELAQWIQDQVAFPSTMVDRIVPAMDAHAFLDLEQEMGVADDFGLISEDFKQWVIEDQFCNGRPKWQLAGATMVTNVLPYEEMKLRMLNGSHSFLAYIGSLCGHTYIYECMEDNTLKALTLALMTQEQALSLSADLNVDLIEYAHSLISRFSNKNIKHQTAQIAMDGSQKLPPRAIDPILTLLNTAPFSKEQPPQLLSLLLAGWMHFIQGKHDPDFTLVDPESKALTTLLTPSNSTSLSESLLSFKPVFNKDFLQHPELSKQVINFYNAIEKQGIRAVLNGLSHTLRTQ
ncbi:mannitol dehydrogenase family protein [Marinomonas sp. 15G1-11]|mgnify:CR=1 FL=1|uniref:Mannitol dehydrogenase family protein n=1 Tax=Marinomonas phaeophyticola TaxID=3004091 RepID=A0ABT4JRB4_9GAMM|nr:mannitol dehydrogenase family protein [Marinomonas sp. 15G1-11]MCZ2720925.1 mannitol dehydrogenase family protein [Marinomonas sp. 15G1-11]